VSWLRKQQASLQLTVEADVDSVEHDGVALVAAELVEVVPAAKVTGSGPGDGPNSSGPGGGPESASRLTSRLVLAPLERLAVPHALSGAAGENRSSAFCYIQANHDLDAVRAYLNRYRDQPKTLRAALATVATVCHKRGWIGFAFAGIAAIYGSSATHGVHLVGRCAVSRREPVEGGQRSGGGEARARDENRARVARRAVA
jgi:hypothetical protein